jgi:hypothetical protein
VHNSCGFESRPRHKFLTTGPNIISMREMLERPVFADHDGTLTDSSKEISEYSSLVVEYNALRLGLTVEESEKLLNSAKEKILKDPGNYGWKWGKDKLIVAPASDHYLFNQVATEIILSDFIAWNPIMKRKIEENLGGKEKYINDLFISCVPKLGIFYRPEAKEFLTELAERRGENGWAIVTNSGAEKVIKKLAKLNLGFDPKVVGGAKKMEINRNWIGLLPIGPYKGFPGYPERGIELQRETFYNILKNVAGDQIKNMIVVEDIAEFVSWIDFLSENNPEWKDAKTTLVLTQLTPEWEKNRYAGDHKNRFSSESLMQILNWIERV